MAPYDWNGDGRSNAHDRAIEHHTLDSVNGGGGGGGSAAGCGTWVVWAAATLIMLELRSTLLMLICAGVSIYKFLHSR